MDELDQHGNAYLAILSLLALASVLTCSFGKTSGGEISKKKRFALRPPSLSRPVNTTMAPKSASLVQLGFATRAVHGDAGYILGKEVAPNISVSTTCASSPPPFLSAP